MLIGIDVSYLRSALFYSICLYIDSRQGCTTSSSEWNISMQKKNDWKKKEKQNQLFLTPKIIVFVEEKKNASNLLPIYIYFHQVYKFSI
jgi:hypothetical protein